METTQSLLSMIEKLQEKINYLEEETIENTNLIYQLLNATDAIDRRIDIVAAEFSKNDNV